MFRPRIENLTMNGTLQSTNQELMKHREAKQNYQVIHIHERRRSQSILSYIHPEIENLIMIYIRRSKTRATPPLQDVVKKDLSMFYKTVPVQFQTFPNIRWTFTFIVLDFHKLDVRFIVLIRNYFEYYTPRAPSFHLNRWTHAAWSLSIGGCLTTLMNIEL